MRTLFLAFLCSMILSLPAFGQVPDETTPAASEDEGPVEDYQLQRGLYLSGNLGVFLTFSGVRGNSNVQPYESINFGYDLNDMFSIEASVGFGHSSSNARVQAADNNGSCTGATAGQVSDTPIYDNRLNGGAGGVQQLS